MKRHIQLLRKNMRIITASFLLAGNLFAVAAPASAAALTPTTNTFAAACSDVRNSSDRQKFNSNGQNCLFTKYINPFIRFLAAFAGIAVAATVVAGSIMYSSAGGDPGKVAKAKGMISKAIIALLCFLFLASFLNWVVPGGITGRG
ncbi:MAG TPA: hypothetical protein VFI74_02500 [Candidatus Saccharimonadales bacterium]|nr:hypothetical protein [Candidatus Saccharimonadales bacterium]